LIPPSGCVPPARFVRLAFDGVIRDLDVAKVSRLILVKITLTLETKRMLVGKDVDAFYYVALERRALVS